MKFNKSKNCSTIHTVIELTISALGISTGSVFRWAKPIASRTHITAETTNIKNNVKGKKIRVLGLVAVAVLAIAIVIIAVMFTNNITNIQTQKYDLEDFTEISAGNGFNLQITKGNEYSINVTTASNRQDRVDIYTSGGTLIIKLKPGLSFSASPLKAEITMPDLEKIQLSEGASATAHNFNLSHNFAAYLTGGSSLTMTGQALNLTVNGLGGANLNLSEFQVNNVNVDLNEGSQCTLNLNGRIAGTLSGGAKLTYIGNPALDELDISGGASMHQADSK
jgi:hypothetical protein